MITSQVLVDYIKVVETAPEVLKNVKRTTDGDLTAEIRAIRDLVADVSTRVERLWRRGTNVLEDADVALQNQAAKTKMLQVIHGFASGMAAQGQVSRADLWRFGRWPPARMQD